MCAQSNVFLMTPDARVVSAVSQALSSNGHLLAGGAIRDARELQAQLSRDAASIIIVDLDPQPRQMLSDLERLIARFPACRCVALSESVHNDLLMEAMQAGVRRVLVKDSIGAELQGVLNRLTPTGLTEAAPRGRMVTVLSASGGAGATTIAINVADELAEQAKSPSLIIDLDERYGAVSPFLGLEPHYAVDHILQYTGRVDANLITSTATQHGERLHVLASPASTQFATPHRLDLDQIDRVADAARRAYAHVVVDAPRVSMDAAATLAGQSAAVLLVMQLTVKDIRIARATLDALRERRVDMDRVVPIANRWVKRQMISVDEASKALGGIKVRPVRNDYVAAVQGLNLGQTLSQSAPRSPFRRDLLDLLPVLVPANA